MGMNTTTGMGIRKKIMLGFLALGLLLFFSGLTSYFELNRLSRSTQSMLDASLKNMELSKTMLDAVQDQNTALLQMMVAGNPEYDSLLIEGRIKFDKAVAEAKERIAIRDLPDLDSIYAANVRYNEVVNSHIGDRFKPGNINWFFDIYKTSYSSLTSSIKTFMISSQNMMDVRATQLERNAYRATMPGMIALAIAILIIVMFFYLIDIYYISPVLKITKGLNNYINLKVPFKVQVEGRDEVYKLKEYIEILISQLKKQQEK